jgi:hypothetical protein
MARHTAPHTTEPRASRRFPRIPRTVKNAILTPICAALSLAVLALQQGDYVRALITTGTGSIMTLAGAFVFWLVNRLPGPDDRH